MFKLSTRQQLTTATITSFCHCNGNLWIANKSKKIHKTATLHGQVQEQEKSAENTVKCAQTEINNEHWPKFLKNLQDRLEVFLEVWAPWQTLHKSAKRKTQENRSSSRPGHLEKKNILNWSNYKANAAGKVIEGENSPTDSCANKCWMWHVAHFGKTKGAKRKGKLGPKRCITKFVNKKKAKTIWKVKTQKRKRQNAARMMRIRCIT